MIYDHDTWINQNTPYLFNSIIIEYDIHDAGLSLSKEYNLLPQSIIEELDRLPKKEKVIKLGKIQRKNREYTEGLKKAFPDIRRRFMEANEITELDMLAIKKDAIFTLKKCEVVQFGEVEFRPKHEYTSFIMLPNKKEVYYNRDEIDVKGIGDDALNRHTTGILSMLKVMISRIEASPQSTKLRAMRVFVDEYKSRKLPLEYYREFDENSLYREDVNGEIGLFNEYWNDKISSLDISYNYFNVVIPLAKLTV